MPGKNWKSSAIWLIWNILYCVYRNDRKRCRGDGVCLYKKTEIRTKVVLKFETSDIEYLFVEVQLGSASSLIGIT